jgi:hypothetical protein
LDSVVESVTGKSYQSLKNTYGALRAIQDDVLNRAIVDARKNAKGFFDLGEVFATGDLVSGLLSMNPAVAVRGTVMRGVINAIKSINNPNRIVKNMFSVVDRAYKPIAKESVNVGERLLEGVPGQAQKLISGPAKSKILEASSMAGEGFERVMPKEAAERIGAQVKRVMDAVNGRKALPAPQSFERVSPQEAYKRIREFAFKYWSPSQKKIVIPDNIIFGSKAKTILQQMKINPLTGELPNQKALTAFEIAWKRAKQQ